MVALAPRGVAGSWPDAREAAIFARRLTRDAAHGRERNRRGSRVAAVQGPAGRVGGAAPADRGGLRRLAGRRRRRARGGRRRRAQGRMVDRARQRRLPRFAVLPWRGLLLGLDREPSPDGDGSGAGGGDEDAGGRVPARPRTSVSRGLRRRLEGVALSARAGISRLRDRRRRRRRGRRPPGRAHEPAAERGGGGARLPMARLALDRSDHGGSDDGDQGFCRSAHPRGLSRRTGRGLRPRD